MDGSILQAEMSSLTAGEDGGFVATLDGREVRSRAVLLATGIVDQAPVLPGLEPVMRRGLLRQCPICDGHQHSGQRIAVLGDGEHAQREALFLSHYSPHVSVVRLTAQALSAEPKDASFAAAAQAQRVVRLDSPVAQARLQDDGSVALVLQDCSSHVFDILYAALGCRPRSDLALPLGASRDDTGQLQVDRHCRTSVSGLYAAGDVVSGLDQLAVAIGHGAIAATAIHNHC